MFVFCFLNFCSYLYYFLLLSLGLFIKQLRFFFFKFLEMDAWPLNCFSSIFI